MLENFARQCGKFIMANLAAYERRNDFLYNMVV